MQIYNILLNNRVPDPLFLMFLPLLPTNRSRLVTPTACSRLRSQSFPTFLSIFSV